MPHCPTHRPSFGAIVAIAIAVACGLASAAHAPTTPPSAAPLVARVEGRGRPVVLIPGLMSSGEVWDDLVAHYRDRYQLHVLTLAGFAGVPSTTGPFLTTARDAVLAYVEREKLDRPIIVGHSLGGFLALWMGATAPDRVGPIVAVDGVPFLPALLTPGATVDSVRSQAEQMKAMYAAATPEQLDARNRFTLQTMIREPEQVTRAAAWAAASDPARVAQAVHELMTTDIRPEMVRVTAPVLMVAAAPAGLEEAAVKERYVAQLRGCADARVVVASGARHFVMLDDAAFLYGAIDRFMGDVTPGVGR